MPFYRTIYEKLVHGGTVLSKDYNIQALDQLEEKG
jgi:hypothetical protein